MNKLLTLQDIDLHNKKVFLRVDYNVVSNGKIIDEFRVRASLPTIKYLLEQNCSIILASHNGRPEGKVVESMSLRPVARLLPRLLNRDVAFFDDCVGEEVSQEAEYLRAGDIVLLENLRFHPGEEANDKTFATQLANLAEVYINDAFAAIHRAHASTVGVAKLLPHAAGKLVQKEYDTFEMLMHKPPRPYTAIIGGAKISDKIEVLDELLKHVDALLIGGAMANTFLAALGNTMQKSLVEKSNFVDALKIIKLAKTKKVKLVLPTDVIVAKKIDSKQRGRIVPIDQLEKDDIALDIGPDTMKAFDKTVAESNTVFWNGTLGMAELSAFAKASDNLAHTMISSDAQTIVGGGDTAAFVDTQDLAEHFSFVSTGGGASLELLAGKKLPGIEVLLKK
ncbi:phosphoglycerate kinase [Candidatus Saccharibacteria bacterium]|nr:phosphoglycerate kinase [Candidatus Saccharibacteria bacterium]